MTTVIIGNGILGITTALRLALKAVSGDRIVVIGKSTKPGSATLAAGAMLNSFCEIEVGSLEKDIDMARFDLSYRAAKMWPGFVLAHMDTAIKRNCLVTECRTCEGPRGACYELGTYLINNSSSDSLDDANFNAVVKAMDDFLEPYHEVDPKSIPNYNPHERHRASRAVYIPNEGWLNPKLTLRSIEVSVANFPFVEMIDDEVVRLHKLGNQIESVELKDGRRICGDNYVVTTGATASELINGSGLGIQIPRIFHSVGVSIQIKSPNDKHIKTIRTPNRGLACGLYTVPFYQNPDVPHDELLIGSSSYISPTILSHAKVESVASLLNMAIEQINRNFFRATITTINVGSRPLSADTYPVIGRTSIPNLIVATGTKRDGFHLAPVISEALCQLVYNEPTDPQLEYFKPERELIRNLSREEAIEHGVRHLVSASYQHGFIPSHDRLSERIEQMYKNDLEVLHDKVGAVDWGIPVELIDMYRYNHIQ